MSHSKIQQKVESGAKSKLSARTLVVLLFYEGCVPSSTALTTGQFYLSVEQNVDDWVVQGSALGKKSRGRHKYRSKLSPLIGENVPGHAGVGHPAHQEGDDHDYDHTRDLFLRSLGGFRLLLLGCSLKEAGYHIIRGPVSHPNSHKRLRLKSKPTNCFSLDYRKQWNLQLISPEFLCCGEVCLHL